MSQLWSHDGTQEACDEVHEQHKGSSILLDLGYLALWILATKKDSIEGVVRIKELLIRQALSANEAEDHLRIKWHLLFDSLLFASYGDLPGLLLLYIPFSLALILRWYPSGTVSSQLNVNAGLAHHSVSFQHLLSYPIISDGVHTFESGKYGQRSIPFGNAAYQTFDVTTTTWFQKPYQHLLLYIKVDSFGDDILH
ncbi:hypothetical protein FOVSG1_012017 [Fusarium oxysporum f. sp. vasinfectum]